MRPMAAASGAFSLVDSKIISVARVRPIRRGRRWVPPAPGIKPRLVSVWPMVERESSTISR